MNKTFCLLLYSSVPFVNAPFELPVIKSRSNAETAPQKETPPWSASEIYFFEEVNENLIPLLWTFERLEKEKVPFKIALCLSPVFISALSNKYILQRHGEYLDLQIEFGKNQLNKKNEPKEFIKLTNNYLERFLNIKEYFKKKNNDILEVIKHFNRLGNIELLASPATDCFLPFYISYPAVIHAQLKTGLTAEKLLLNEEPAGLWLPFMAYHQKLDPHIIDKHFNYTIVDSHGLLLAKPQPKYGTFFPVRTPEGLTVFARDYYLTKALKEINSDSFLDTALDAGFELAKNEVEAFCGEGGSRNASGYKYKARSKNNSGNAAFYEEKKAKKDAESAAASYAELCFSHLNEAAKHFDDKSSISIAAVSMNNFGRNWCEGNIFIETFFREIQKKEIQLITPYEYLKNVRTCELQPVEPLYSSAGTMGYMQAALDSSNDWIYRHIFQAIERITETAERFTDSGIRERLLNQAVREMFLSQSSVLAKMLSEEDRAAFAKKQINEHLSIFTALYESLGNSFISVKWLSALEERDYIFPELNYRILRRFAA